MSFRRLEQEIMRRASAPGGYRTIGGEARARAAAPDTPAARAEREARAKARKGDFSSFGEFLQAVGRSAVHSSLVDPRLVRAPHGANETDPTAGGFAAGSQWADSVFDSIYSAAVLAPLCDVRQTDKPSDWKLPGIDETSRADGSREGGTLAYWTAEAVQPNSSYPHFKLVTYSGHRMIAISIVTNELMQDSKLLEFVVRRAFASEAGFKLDLAILQGTGAGTPLGLVNGPSTITVAKDVSQTAATISQTNLSSMWSRLAAPCRKRAVWILNEDAEAQISLLAASAGSGGANGMYYPQGHGGNECALLYGRPIVVAEQSSVLGTVGDITLADLSQYTIIQNYDVAVSAEQNALTDETIFRFRWRGDGKSLWSSPITPYNGSSTRSPFVQLAARS